MKLYSFFRLLNMKIRQYENAASENRGMYNKYPLTVIWIEDINDSSTDVHS